MTVALLIAIAICLSTSAVAGAVVVHDVKASGDARAQALAELALTKAEFKDATAATARVQAELERTRTALADRVAELEELHRRAEASTDPKAAAARLAGAVS